MKNHTKIYLKEMGYSVADFIPCERCGLKAEDIHHIDGRGKGKDVIENLMALCRLCHDQHHSRTGLSKEELREIHVKRLNLWKN